MKLFHISDLHIGKLLHTYDMGNIQRDVFGQIIDAAKAERPDVIMIAGDVYDKSAPSGEAFKLLDLFLRDLSMLDIPVLIVSGNHDSNLRLNYGETFLEKGHIYVAASLPQNDDEYLKKIELSDEYGTVCFTMMPFIKPIDARNLFGDTKEIHTYQDAVETMLQREPIDFSKRNVLIAHQYFVDGEQKPEKRDSEMNYITVGGLDSVDISVVEGFDYVALGHIHTAQKVGKDHIRYSGTPLKYSVSEAKDQKYITQIELKEKGQPLNIKMIPLAMEPDVKKLRGTLDEVIEMTKGTVCKDFVSITLTDKDTLFRPKDRLGEFYTNILEIQLDNERINALLRKDISEESGEDPLALFAEFYEELNGEALAEEQQQLMEQIIDKVSEGK